MLSSWRYRTRCSAVVAAVLAVFLSGITSAQVPARANQYQRDLIRQARSVWGLSAPVALFAAQVHQESSWRPDARSPYAAGLAQFTPDTAEWIGTIYAELAAPDVFDPRWALRALVRYDFWLWSRARDTATDCDRAAMMLSAYNGGLGWLNRDRRLATSKGADASRWWGQVERYSARAEWAIEENRQYPRRILRELQGRYVPQWGRGVLCDG